MNSNQILYVDNGQPRSESKQGHLLKEAKSEYGKTEEHSALESSQIHNDSKAKPAKSKMQSQPTLKGKKVRAHNKGELSTTRIESRDYESFQKNQSEKGRDYGSIPISELLQTAQGNPHSLKTQVNNKGR